MMRVKVVVLLSSLTFAAAAQTAVGQADKTQGATMPISGPQEDLKWSGYPKRAISRPPASDRTTRSRHWGRRATT